MRDRPVSLVGRRAKRTAPPAPPSRELARDWQEATDTGLVVAIARFSEEALAEAYRRHGGAVFALSVRLIGDRGNAEDITQEIFLRLWQSPDRYDPERGTLRSYLLTQTHSRAIDILRQDTARRERQMREARLQASAPYELEEEVSDLVAAEKIRQALEVLSEGERRAIELAYFGGYTYRDVAAQLGEPEGTVKSRIRTGLRRLHDELFQKGVEL
jgi:RNA polymerase sigma-70 factor (ECF subfamily)